MKPPPHPPPPANHESLSHKKDKNDSKLKLCHFFNKALVNYDAKALSNCNSNLTIRIVVIDHSHKMIINVNVGIHNTITYPNHFVKGCTMQCEGFFSTTYRTLLLNFMYK